VHQAEQKILDLKENKSYLPILGSAKFSQELAKVVFGESHDFIKNNDLILSQVPGGTGGLKVAADLIHAANPDARVWLSDPTWVNHNKIFSVAGLNIQTYKYYDLNNHILDFDGMISDLSQAKEGDVLLLHGCCHNPTGMDLNKEQWQKVGDLASEKKLLVLIDIAYQGFGNGLDEDRIGIDVLSKMPLDLIIVSSCSKNFSLYNQRVGLLCIYLQDKSLKDKVEAKLKVCVRTNYSNPPAHGANIVSTILSDNRLYNLWVDELDYMRNRIKSMRSYFNEVFDAEGIKGYEHVIKQNGMFSMLPLSKADINILKKDHHVYTAGSGRINVSALTNNRIEILADLIKNKL
jgi:aromatic-amino-acid transaminase